MSKLFPLTVYINTILIAIVSLYLFIAPIFLLNLYFQELNAASEAIPSFVFQWHRTLSAGFETWARQRIISEKAKHLSLQNIAETEWPIFSAVFYLWSAQSLQTAWELHPKLFAVQPVEYAHGAIKAAAALISDPKQAEWVQKHWGQNYLERENLFYRMLLINGLTIYQRLSKDRFYEPLLKDQVESLAAEIDQSPYGLLDDYPGQCYPIDIVPAIAGILRADAVLGTNHSQFAARAIRGFEGSRLDDATQLPAYVADSKTGLGIGPARGVGIAFMLIWAQELWPETASRWYASYEKHFWQDGRMLVGVREFSRHASRSFENWSFSDVDAGPVLAGYGSVASAFGIGAARANGRLDQAYSLSAEALLASWPLLDGTFLIPRMLSVFPDAPYVGEAILLFNFTRQPGSETVLSERRELPLVIYLGLALYLSAGLLCISSGIGAVRRWRNQSLAAEITIVQRILLSLKILICFSGVISAFFVNPFFGLLLLFIAQEFSIKRIARKTDDNKVK